MMRLSTIFGLLGNVTSFLIFISPIKTFYRIVRNRSTEDFDVLPYVTALLTSSLWVYYGLTRPDRILIAIVDAIGVALEATYVSLYFFYAPPDKKARTVTLVLLLNVVFFGGVFLFTQLMTTGELQYNVIGWFSVCLCSISYTSPLAIMNLVITTRSVEFMPFLLSFCIFINGVTWTTYAFLVGDVFIGLPSGAGFLLGLGQLILYGIYMDTRDPRQQQHQHLIEPTEENM